MTGAVERITKRRELVRARLEETIAELLAGCGVWVYGSVLRPGRFEEHSDVDLALERLPEGKSLWLVQSLVSERVGREVDVCLLDETRLAAKIRATGQRWTP